MLKGLIDLHTHGIGRYDTRTSQPDDILKMAELHARGGTAAILPTIYSGTIKEMRLTMEAVRMAMEAQASAHGRRGKSKTGSSADSPTQQPAQILGVHLEGPFLNPLRCGAQDPKTFIAPRLSHLKRLIDGYEDIIRIITVAPEISGALRVIERCASQGVKVNMGHSDATFEQAHRGKKAGAAGVSHLFNAMRPFHHREPGLAGFGLVDEDMFIEVIADGIHLDPATLRLILKTKYPGRILLVSDTVKGAGHRRRPLYTEDGSLAGSAVTLSGAVTLLERAGMPRNRSLAFASRNPLKYLGH